MTTDEKGRREDGSETKGQTASRPAPISTV